MYISQSSILLIDNTPSFLTISSSNDQSSVCNDITGLFNARASRHIVELLKVITNSESWINFNRFMLFDSCNFGSIFYFS